MQNLLRPFTHPLSYPKTLYLDTTEAEARALIKTLESRIQFLEKENESLTHKKHLPPIDPHSPKHRHEETKEIIRKKDDVIQSLQETLSIKELVIKEKDREIRRLKIESE